MIVLMRKAPMMIKSTRDTGRVSRELRFLVKFTKHLQAKVVQTEIRDRGIC